MQHNIFIITTTGACTRIPYLYISIHAHTHMHAHTQTHTHTHTHTCCVSKPIGLPIICATYYRSNHNNCQYFTYMHTDICSSVDKSV